SVYKITNTANDKVYVGCTAIHYLKRWRAHINTALNPNSCSTPFHCAIRQYGSDCFVPELLEDCAEDWLLLRNKEREWIRTLNSQVPHGYNSNVRLLTDEQVALIRFNVLSLKIKEYAALFGVSDTVVFVAK